MKEFFKTILIEPFTEEHSYVGRGINIIMGLIGWLAFLMVLGLIIWGLAYSVNVIGRHDEKGVGIIYDKTFVPEHYEMRGKVNTFIPDSWYLNVRKNNLKDCIKVSYSFYSDINISDSVHIDYYTGRLYNSLYIKSIYK